MIAYHVPMNVRPILLPKTPDPQLVQKVADLAQNIENGISKKRDVQFQLHEFNRLTGKQYVPTDFWELSDPRAAREFAEIALCKVKQFLKVPDPELLEIIRFLMEGQGSELDLYYWSEFLRLHLPHPAPTDLIFRSDLSAEEILERLKAFKPIQM